MFEIGIYVNNVFEETYHTMTSLYYRGFAGPTVGGILLDNFSFGWATTLIAAVFVLMVSRRSTVCSGVLFVFLKKITGLTNEFCYSINYWRV
jgi:hypothetical protein